MKIKTELLSKEITNCIINNLENIDADKIADTTAICALSEIKDIIKKVTIVTVVRTAHFHM